MMRGTVCSNVGTYGSVGALGEQSPKATWSVSGQNIRPNRDYFAGGSLRDDKNGSFSRLQMIDRRQTWSDGMDPSKS